MKTAALIEGFAGGPIYTRGFRKSLANAGFRVIRNRHKADILIAHSAGIYAIPKDARASLVILIGPTYWPEKFLLARFRNNAHAHKKYLIDNFGWPYLIWTQLNQIFYFFVRHWYMWLGILNNNKLSFLDSLERPGRKIILVRNDNDAYCSPDIEKVVKNRANVRFVALPGVHDDFVKNPTPYIRLILEAEQ